MKLQKHRFLISSALVFLAVLWFCTWRLLVPLSQADAEQEIQTLILEAGSVAIIPHNLNPTTRSMFDTNIGPLPTLIDGSASTARKLILRGLSPQSGFTAFRWRNPFVYDEFSDFYLEIRCTDTVGAVTAVLILDMSLTKCRITTNDGTRYGDVSGLHKIPEWTDWVWSTIDER